MSDLFCFLDGFGAGSPAMDKSILIVTAPTGATLTATLGDTVKTAAEKTPGEYWLKNLDLGEWTLKLTQLDQTATTTYNIEEFGVYRTSMAFFAATIKITYPGGSTCTCFKDDRTYTAPDTSGAWDCVVDSAGDWTVKLTADGQEPASRVVTITDDGQTVSIVIAHEITLYDSGDQCSNVTGGWEIVKGEGEYGKNFDATLDADKITVQCGEYYSEGYVQTVMEIDRGNLTTLYAVVSLSDGKNFKLVYGGASIDIPVGNDKTVKLDIANTNNQIVKFSHGGGTGADGTLTIKRVYIAKGDTV